MTLASKGMTPFTIHSKGALWDILRSKVTTLSSTNKANEIKNTCNALNKMSLV